MRKKIVVLLSLLMAVTSLLCACDTGRDKEKQSESGNVSGQDSYVFEYNGIKMQVNEDISPAVAALGEPLNYYEATSCAFEGLDKIYTYASFQLETFPKDGKDIIACIYFRDDMIKTKEGVSLYMTKNDMIKAYGEAAEVSGTAHTYRKGHGFLRFILNEADEIISIEYQTETTYK